jgi:hypothetical protein
LPNYNTLEDLFLAVIEEQLATGLATVLRNQGAIIANQEAAADASAQIAADVLAIKAFVGMTGPLSLSAADVAALAQVQKASLDLEHAVEAISTEPPAPKEGATDERTSDQPHAEA